MTPSAIEIASVSKIYQTLGGYFGGHRTLVPAVNDVSLGIRSGEVFGLVGESGSGKSTLARLIVGLERPSSGHVSVAGVRLDGLRARELRELRRHIQIVFQDPYTSLDPLMTVGASLEEPLQNFAAFTSGERAKEVDRLIDDVGLPSRAAQAYPHQLSGGERQRACIARALALNPKILVCDEPVSSLDKSIQAQMINLFRDLKERYGLTYLFISHDLSVVNHLCDQVAVMLKGRIVEQGEREDILFRPAHPYTQALMASAVYFIDGTSLPENGTMVSRPPSADGCPFEDRCYQAQAVCRETVPDNHDVRNGHRAACHVIEDRAISPSSHLPP